jgi:hypothetical protein
MNLVERAKNILLQPNQEWPVIAVEAADTKSLLIQYAVPLAAIGPIAMWLGHSLVGISVGPLGTYRTPIVGGLAFAVMTYVLSLVSVFVVGLIIDALAPSFGGEKNGTQAMKCAVYAHTPGWLGGIFHLLPALSILAVVASLYGLYLLYLGLPALMKAPRDKAVGYSVVVVICAIVLAIVVGVIGSIVGFGGGAMRGGGMFSGAPGTSLGTARDQPAPDSVLGKLDTLSKKMDESGKKMDEANKKGDTAAAMGAAMEGLSTMASGGKKVEPLDAGRLKDFLPETLDGMPRADVTTEQTSFGPMSVTMASATYQDAGRKVRIGVGDMAAAGGLFALTSMMGAGQSKESDAGYEKIHKVDGRLVIEKLDRKSGASEYGVVLADRFVVNTSSPNVDPPALRAMIAKLDLGKLEAMKDVGVTK